MWCSKNKGQVVPNKLEGRHRTGSDQIMRTQGCPFGAVNATATWPHPTNDVANPVVTTTKGENKNPHGGQPEIYVL